ncbi:MlaE family lipid ABC transporter permease subunit [Bradyrhizobium sp. WD16]|uniref:ABC transporter permease n=1 Tax=Bradyrhizobium sp. WD16 TaxID=1521768 RepID=UPI0020A32C9D|nr:MlaE family lipid ABC transporter permease subunit [Bradyrhizobium sp. WD16]UTD28440.1 ABC transporter permease [Bradyrhizobium sp. WD16]
MSGDKVLEAGVVAEAASRAAELAAGGVPRLERVSVQGRVALRASGAWIAEHARLLEGLIDDAGSAAPGGGVLIDVSAVGKLDTFGAWLLERLCRSLAERGADAKIAGLSADYSSLVDEVRRVGTTTLEPSPRMPLAAMLESVGRNVVQIGETVVALLAMSGALLAAAGRVARRPSTFRLTSMIHHLDQVGWRAVPIIMLITFLIGCIIAQQGIFHFRQFGADVFVVDMLGVLVLREIGVLIVAIMVAGRSGSSYTAELGSMKMREEIDALRTMGFDPVEVLILPRVLALLVALPMLAFIGGMVALYGGGLVAWLYGGVDPDAFLFRLRESISISHFVVGMVKAPFMALTIGVVASVEGLLVEGSAESLGQHTTASVVKSIFFVIVMDGVFAIFFASIGI